MAFKPENISKVKAKKFKARTLFHSPDTEELRSVNFAIDIETPFSQKGERVYIVFPDSKSFINNAGRKHFEEGYETDYLAKRIRFYRYLDIDKLLDLTDPDIQNDIEVTKNDVMKNTEITKEIGRISKDLRFQAIIAPIITGGDYIIVFFELINEKKAKVRRANGIDLKKFIADLLED